MDNGTVLPEARNVRRKSPFSADLGLELRHDALQRILRVNVRHAHGSQFILGISEHSTQGRIREFERLCLNVGNQDAIGTFAKQRAVSGLRLP